MDPEADVRRAVCASLVCLMETHPDKLMPQMEQIITYMLHSTRDSVLEVGRARRRHGPVRGRPRSHPSPPPWEAVHCLPGRTGSVRVLAGDC